MSVPSVEKGLMLLEFLAGAGGPVPLQDLTAATSLPKPTAFRLLRSLQTMGFVSRPPGRREYLIGPRAAHLAGTDPHAALKAVARPRMKDLHDKFNETVNLGVLSGHDVLYIEFIETTQPLRMIVSPGQSDRWFSTALGRAAATQLEAADLDRLIAETRIRRITPDTVRNRADLSKILLRAREQGFAEEMGESVPGVACLAASLAPLGHPEAAVSMAVPLQRLSNRRKASITRALREIAKS